MSFRADLPTVKNVVPSSNHDERTTRIDILLLHYTGMPSAAEALARLTDRQAKVSSHYFVDEDGRIDQLVPEVRRAWHAGEASWKGAVDINSRSIGIEIVNPGHQYGYRDFPDVQIDAVIALCRDIVARRHIRRERVLAHSDVAPTRKDDPGEKFPGRALPPPASDCGSSPRRSALDGRSRRTTRVRTSSNCRNSSLASATASRFRASTTTRPALSLRHSSAISALSASTGSRTCRPARRWQSCSGKEAAHPRESGGPELKELDSRFRGNERESLISRPVRP